MARSDPLDVFRAFDRLALAVHARTDLWTFPMRLMRVADDVLDRAGPAGTRLALAALLGRTAGATAVPRWLSSQVQRHLAEFDHLYALARQQSNLYATAGLIARRRQWEALVPHLRAARVEKDAIESLDQYMAVRVNHLLATGGSMDEPLRQAYLPAVAQGAKALPKAVRGLADIVEIHVLKELNGRRLSTAARAQLPWGELGAFGKLQRLLPEDDPAWRELAHWIAARKASGKPVVAAQLQGAIGEIVALRTPGVVDFLRRETGRVLAQDPSLGAQGWRVVIQPRPVTMAQAGRALKDGAPVPAMGLGGNGESFDLSVWLVKDAKGETPVAMPVVRVQVKSGKEDNLLDGLDQSLVRDEWRQFSDTVTLDVGMPGAPQARNFELKPPDTFSVVRVLVGAEGSQAKLLQAKLPPGGDLNLFRMPLTAQEFGKIGGVLSRP